MNNSLLGLNIDSKILVMSTSSSNSNNGPLPLIKLIGDPEENFYQLGLKDRETFLPVKEHVSNLIKMPWAPIDRAIKELGQLYLKQGLKHCPEFYKNVSAYAEGCGIKYEEMALTLLVPEYLSVLTKWLPGVKTTLLGCSSYFYWDETFKAPVQGRILDFPLAGTYDKTERAVLYKFKNQPQILSYTTSGLPYPSLTSMTDAGITFGLHQKFTDKFNPKGTPIFELVYQMLSQCGDKKSILDFLKSSQSLTTWALYLSCENGDVLAIDMMGDEMHVNEHHLEPGEVFYFNNMPEDPKMAQFTKSKDFPPHGMGDYCDMRTQIAHKKRQKLKDIPNLDDEKFLEVIATPLLEKVKASKDWKLDPTSPSSITISTMNAKLGRTLYVNGEAPKYFKGQFTEMNDVWSGHVIKANSIAGNFTPRDYDKGMRELIIAQTCFDKGENTHIYHHLQMAQDYLHEYPEAVVAEFYFHVFQYMLETHKKVQGSLLQGFKNMQGLLPPYLEEHNCLFINRLEMILGKEQSIRTDDFQTSALQEIWKAERKIPAILLHKATATLMNPRIDILDIIYAHFRS